ncbi:MAG: hypothetical protein Q8P71_02350, partial [bacterium]|nr:hypothetical protein [bacterium]
FQWGTTQNLGQETSIQTISSSANVNTAISGLAPSTTYHFRVVAQNQHNTAFGSIMSFTTQHVPAPTPTPTPTPAPTPVPTVTIRANNNLGQTSVPYGSNVLLSWTSSNATSCVATGAWSGGKIIAGNENTGFLFGPFSRTYVLTCSGSGGTSNSDSVTVYTQAPYISLTSFSPTLSVNLVASPSVGQAPLHNVSLTASVSGTATGNIRYLFDCQNDGSWEHDSSWVSSSAYSSQSLCSYASSGTYTARVKAERMGLIAEGLATITVGSPATTGGLKVEKTGANQSMGQSAFARSFIAKPLEVITFRVLVFNTGSTIVHNVIVRDAIPQGMLYRGFLKKNEQDIGGSMVDGVNIGSLSPGQVITLTYRADVAAANQFPLGSVNLTNTVSATSSNVVATDSATVAVTVGEVLGVTTGPTHVSTGSGSIVVLSLFAVLLALMGMSYVFLLRRYLVLEIIPQARKSRSEREFERAVGEAREQMEPGI